MDAARNGGQENELATDKVNYSMKLFSAVAIVAVCAGHISSVGLSGPFNMVLPYSYQVAAFVFISGYFFSDNAIEDPWGYLVRKAGRLIVPLLLINAVYGLIAFALHQLGFNINVTLNFNSLVIEPFTTGHQFTINMPMWFLPPLFFAELFNLLTSCLLKLINCRTNCRTVEETIVFVLYMTAGAVAIALGGNEGLKPGWSLLFARTLFFLACFGMGRFYKRVLEQYDKARSLWYFLIVLSMQLVVIWLCDGDYTYAPSWCRFPHGIILTYATTILSIAFVLRVCKILAPVIAKSRTILAIADNTFSIMCHHYFGYFLLTTLFAGMALFTPFIPHFDFAAYYDSLGYRYYPKAIESFAFLYLVAGISFSIFVHFCWRRICRYARGRLQGSL